MVSESIYTNLKKPSLTYPIVIENKKAIKGQDQNVLRTQKNSLHIDTFSNIDRK